VGTTDGRFGAVSVRPQRPKRGVLVAWGFTMRASACFCRWYRGCASPTRTGSPSGRDLIARGLGAPLLIVADGAPGLIKAIERCRPASDRRRHHYGAYVGKALATAVRAARARVGLLAV